jgi:hypothetical protein
VLPATECAIRTCGNPVPEKIELPAEIVDRSNIIADLLSEQRPMPTLKETRRTRTT